MVRIRTLDHIEPSLLEDLMKASFDPRFGERWSSEQVISALSLPQTWVCFAYPDGAEVHEPPAGFSLVRVVADEAELLLIAVAPPFRGQGIGRALVDHAVQIAEERSAVHLFLEVRAGNDPAIALYKSCGFQIVGHRPGYYRAMDGKLHDALTMHLTVNKRQSA